MSSRCWRENHGWRGSSVTCRCRWTRSSCRKVHPIRRASYLRRRGATGCTYLLSRICSARKEKWTIRNARGLLTSVIKWSYSLSRCSRSFVTENLKTAHTERRFLCPKLCETAPDDSYRGGIPRGSRTFNPQLNDLPRLSLLAKAPRTCMTSLAIPRQPITRLAAPRSWRSTQGWRYSCHQ